jgi:hypothetical protein
MKQRSLVRIFKSIKTKQNKALKVLEASGAVARE